MNNIIFTKGAPGSGKSTFLAEHGLTPYTISPDDIRLLYGSPQLNLNGKLGINASNDRKVWADMLEIIEIRMQKGDFLIIDATHTKPDDFKKYKTLVEKYRYRAWCLDFSDIPLEEAQERNLKRDPYKIVDPEVVQFMHERAAKSIIPSWITALEKEKFDGWLNPELKDLSHYTKIHHIGDLQGCYTVVADYFKENPMNDNELYIFVGDYIDRGIENHLSVQFVLDLFENKPNCIFLEGNHERYLWEWSNDREIKGGEFVENTQPQLESAEISKAKVRNFCRHLKKYFYYKYGDKTVVVTHGGIPNVPSSFKLTSTSQFVQGVGIYSEHFTCDQNFEKNTPDNYYSLHGHRNTTSIQTKVNTKCFNLEGEVEFGGHLRVAVLDKDGFNTIEVKNNIFKPQKEKQKIEVPFNIENFEEIEKLRKSKHVQEKTFLDNISSFNFKREAFSKGIWNEQTLKARGLFIHNKTYEVIARSYEKFFNIGEMDFTEFEYLKTNFQYPVSTYLKENGYLGLLGYNSETDEVVFTSKSRLDTDHVKWFKEIFLEKYESQLYEIKKVLQDKNLTLIFEVIDPVNDPHIIEYPNRDIVLLDAVKRQLAFEKLGFESLSELATTFGFNLKKSVQVFNDQNEFEQMYLDSIKKTIKEQSPEGYILEDQKGNIVKLKLPYYSFWKAIRDYLEMYAVNKDTRVKGTLVSDPVFIKFMSWIKSKNESYMTKPIIELRKLFLSEVNIDELV